MLTRLKQRVQQLLLSEARAAHRIGLTPNGVTIIGFVFALLAAISYANVTPSQTVWLVVAVALLLISGFCDALDGVLARTYQQTSVFGGFFDSLLDRYADASIFAGIIISGASSVITRELSLLVGLVALVSTLVVSYSRARAEAAGLKMESIGFAERPERIIILAASSLLAIFWLPSLIIGVAAIAVLATFTVIQRAIYSYNNLKQT